MDVVNNVDIEDFQRKMKKRFKLYPFSTEKHAHDIEFRRNRVKNEICDVLSGELIVSNEMYEQMQKLEEELTALLSAVLNSSNGKVCYLTGKQIGLAKECVAWASSQRSSRKEQWSM